jgi:hypothetical protein
MTDMLVLQGFRAGITQGTGVTKFDALGIPVAKIAFKDHLSGGIKSHGTKRACGHAHPTADAPPIIHHDAIEKLVPINGFPRTGRQARCLFTLPANNRDKKRAFHPFKNTDARHGWISGRIAPDGANDFTLPAPRAFLRIDLEYFFNHNFPPAIASRAINLRSEAL